MQFYFVAWLNAILLDNLYPAYSFSSLLKVIVDVVGVVHDFSTKFTAYSADALLGEWYSTY